MRKSRALLFFLACLTSMAVIYQNCSRAEFEQADTDGTISTLSVADDALLAEVCSSLGGTFDATATPQCSINFFDSDAMDELHARICQQLGGVFDSNRTPECALPFVLRDEFINAIINIQNQIQQLRDDLRAIDDVNARIDDLQNQIDNLPTPIDQNALDAALQPLVDQLNQLQSDFDGLDLTQYVTQAELQNAIDSIDGDIAALNATITNLMNSQNVNTQDIASLSGQIQALQDNVSSLTLSFNQLVTDFDNLVIVVNQLQTDLDQIRNDMATQTDLAALAQSLTALIDNLNARVTTLENSNFVNQDNLNDAIAPIMTEVNQLRDQLNALAGSTVDQTVFNNVVTDLTSQINQLTLNLQTLSGGVNNNTAAINAILSQLVLLEDRIIDLEQNGASQEDLQDLQDNLNAQINSLIGRLDGLDTGQDEQDQQIATILQQIQSMQNQLNSNTQNIDQLNTSISDLIAQIQGLSESLDLLSEQVSNNSTNIANILSQLNLIDLRITDIESNSVTQDQLDDVRNSLLQDIALLTDRLGTLEINDANQQQEISDILAQLDEIRNEIGQGGDTIIKFKIIIENRSSYLRNLVQYILKFVKNVSDMDERLEKLYGLYQIVDKPRCLAMGGHHHHSWKPPCRLNLYKHLDITKVNVEACGQGSKINTSARCNEGYKLISCAADPGAYLQMADKKAEWKVVADFVDDRCKLTVNNPRCVDSNSESHQRVTAVCARWKGATHCDAGSVWNQQHHRCQDLDD